MKLSELLRNVQNCRVRGSADVEVSDVAYNTVGLTKGSCFVAIYGEKIDGHKFIGDAIAKGAVAIVSEKAISVPDNVTLVITDNSRRAMAEMSAILFGEPSKTFKLVGVTGTNGKTTITYLLEEIFKEAGMIPGVIGTVEYRFGSTKTPAPHTTPESYELQKLFCRMREDKVSACAMEVSSHALMQHRVTACHFDAAVFTNLTSEHLDYHREMESYFAAKAILFEKLLAKSAKKNVFAVINADDPYGEKLGKLCPVPVRFYGLDRKADVVGKSLKFDASGLSMTVQTNKGSFELRSKLCGKFNAENILAAVACALEMNVDIKVIKNAVEKIAPVPGRFESVPNKKGILALVDYAHTPDALENVLSNARLLVAKGKKLISVFGCGGDRDRAKRPLMGDAAGRLSDVAIVTSDNPRTEIPDTIIDEILSGVKKEAGPYSNGRGYLVMPDRRAAIEKAVEISEDGDVIVVAGKGHEDYQIIGTTKIHFDDREILKELFKEDCHSERK